MPSNPFYSLEQNESYAIITWNESNLTQTNIEELELIIRNLFKKELFFISIFLTRIY
jgi:hypothetical protein